jgi:hypothetical protein
MIKNGHWSLWEVPFVGSTLYGKYPLWEVPFILARFELNFDFFDMCSKDTEISNFMKILPMAAELFHADGRTDGKTGRHDEAKSRFSKFCESA